MMAVRDAEVEGGGEGVEGGREWKGEGAVRTEAGRGALWHVQAPLSCQDGGTHCTGISARSRFGSERLEWGFEWRYRTQSEGERSESLMGKRVVDVVPALDDLQGQHDITPRTGLI